MTAKRTIKELDGSYMHDIRQMFKEVFSAPPWNEDWSDKEQLEYVEKRISRLHELREMPTATKTADEMWKSRIDFFIVFFEKLLNQLKQSRCIIDERQQNESERILEQCIGNENLYSSF